MTWRTRQEVLHRAYIEFQLVNGDRQRVTSDQGVSWVLRVDGSVRITPFEERERRFSHSCMDWLTVLHLPNDEGVVLADTSEELVIWTELQFQNLVLNSTKDCHRPASLHVPKNDGRIWDSLEDSALLSSSNDVA